MENLPLELELRKLGLTEKEVKIYLAGLKLGPTSAGNIARAAKISRPTTYETIEKLEGKDLFAKTRKNKKTYYTAQSPDKILGILRMKKREIEEREREFIRIIATLESKYSKGQGEIKIYKGEEGIKLLMEEILAVTGSSDIFVISSGETSDKRRKREAIYQKIAKRLGKINIQEIYPGEIKPYAGSVKAKVKFSGRLNIRGTLILFDKAIFLYPKKQEGFLIENEVIVRLRLL